MPGKILIVDDEKDMLQLLQRILREKTPHAVTVTTDPLEVPGLLQRTTFDVVLTDLKMPRMDGIQVLEAVKAASPPSAVILMTAYGTIESAIEATRKGAFDYITKPFRKERVLHVIEQAMNVQRLETENSYLREQLEGRAAFPALIGSSTAMERLHGQIQQVAKSTATILITGESGTGKELVARAIHFHSLRKDKPFTPIDCSTLPESIIESELFGHLRGAFTGALKDKKGLVEETHRGTLFLDEIGDLSPLMQVKLLRLLQEGEFKVVGDTRIRRVDVRFIAATHQNLLEKIRRGEFREDLYYRLNVINIQLPPLRARATDIPLLAHHFLRKYSALNHKPVHAIDDSAMAQLGRYSWPGNIRELENVIERGVILTRHDTLQSGDLSLPGPPVAAPTPPPGTCRADIFTMPFKEAKDRLLEDFQAQYIRQALSRHAGNVSQTARELGVKRQYLHRLMRETNLDSKLFRQPPPPDGEP
jgi:DNA-binding NtrC family response regulator